MRGPFDDQGQLFSYISPERRVPTQHPLRTIRELVREVFRDRGHDFRMLYFTTGRPSILPEQLLSALLLQVFYGVRSERQRMEQLDYNRCTAGPWGLRRTTRCGTRRPLRRIASDCNKAICSIASRRRYYITKRSRHCCQTSISPSMAR
jgi:transposase